MLEHILTTTFQQKWLVKLMEFEFSIEYKQGKENVAADALSRLKDIECKALTAQTIQPNVLDRIQSSRVSDASLATIIPALKENSSSHKHYTWLNDQLRRKGKLVVGKDLQLRQELLHWFHNSTPGGHSGKIATCKRIQVVLYWKGLTLDVKQFMQQCATYQQCKYDHSAYLGLLQPLHVPDHVWQHISMDFIEGIPLSNSKQAIFVVVDRLSKVAHFIPLSHPYTASTVAQTFMDHVFKLHGFPSSITSDRDSIFLNKFWQELMAFQGVQLQLSSAYHP